MKQLLIALLCVISMLLSACDKAPEITTEAFDSQEALALIEPIDRFFFEIGQKDEITKQELTAYSDALSEYVLEEGTMGPGWAEMVLPQIFLDLEQYLNSDASTFPLAENQFYPTIFHENIEIVSAEQKHTYYAEEDDSVNRHEIRITLSSRDDRLSDWERTYVFLRDEESAWKLDHMEGVINTSGAKDMLSPKQQ